MTDRDLGCLNDIEIEAALLTAIAKYRPVGMHRHFHLICVLEKLKQAAEKVGRQREQANEAQMEKTETLQNPEAIWQKLSEWYDLEALNDLEDKDEEDEAEEEGGEHEDEEEEIEEGDESGEEKPHRSSCLKCDEGFQLNQSFELETMLAQRAEGSEEHSSEEELSELETTDADSPVKASRKRPAPESDKDETEEEERESPEEDETPARRGTRASRGSAAPLPQKTRRSGRK